MILHGAQIASSWAPALRPFGARVGGPKLGVCLGLLFGTFWRCPLPVSAEEPQNNRPFGILLLGQGGDKAWRSTIDALKQKFSRKFPFEFAPGLADAKTIRKAVELLEKRRVKIIVAVPLFVSSYCDVMDQNRYLLGLREKPASGFSSQPRVHSKVPIILTEALDDHPLLVDILTARAKVLSRDPARASLFLIMDQPSNFQKPSQEWLDTASSLAEKIRQKGGYRSVRTTALLADVRQPEREKNKVRLRAQISVERRGGSVITIPLELSRGKLSVTIPNELDGLFVKYDGKTILPNPRILEWVEDTAIHGARLPDMRMFRDGGASSSKMLPKPPPIRP